jgi:hypothetical protein
VYDEFVVLILHALSLVSYVFWADRCEGKLRPMATELLNAFGAELQGLQRAEKKDINALSMIAEDNKQFAQGLVAVIEKHLTSVCFLGPGVHEKPWEAGP